MAEAKRLGAEVKEMSPRVRQPLLLLLTETWLAMCSRNSVFDEVMCSWLGMDASELLGGVPWRVKIIRKPKGMGVEFKSLLDCSTSIMLPLELCEGAQSKTVLEYKEDHGAGAAYVVRLTKPWWGSGRHVFGDSYFSSVNTCVALSHVGLFYTGVVKTAVKMLCVQFFQNYEFAGRGSHVAVSAKVKDVSVFAVS